MQLFLANDTHDGKHKNLVINVVHQTAPPKLGIFAHVTSFYRLNRI